MRRIPFKIAGCAAALLGVALLCNLFVRADRIEQGYQEYIDQPRAMDAGGAGEQREAAAEIEGQEQSEEVEPAVLAGLNPQLTALLRERCEAEGVPVALAAAVIQVESAGDAAAVNGDCVGLMQLDSSYSRYYMEHTGVQGITAPGDNIVAGVWYLGELLREYPGDTELALAVYNLGPTGARTLWEAGARSTAYTHKVLQVMEHSESCWNASNLER